MVGQVPVSIVEATEQAISAADLEDAQAGLVAVIFKVAQAIDDIDEDGLNPAGKLDNVSIPTYLKYSAALGLVIPEPESTTRKKAGEPGGASKLGKLRAVNSPKAAG